MSILELLSSMALMIFFLGVFVSFVVYLGVLNAQEYAERELRVQQFLEQEKLRESATGPSAEDNS